MSEKIRIVCPNCGRAKNAPQSWVGRKLKCACGNSFAISPQSVSSNLEHLTTTDPAPAQAVGEPAAAQSHVNERPGGLIVGLIAAGATACITVGVLVGVLLKSSSGDGDSSQVPAASTQPAGHGEGLASDRSDVRVSDKIPNRKDAPETMVVACPHASVVGVEPSYDEELRVLRLTIRKGLRSSPDGYVKLLSEIGEHVLRYPIDRVVLTSQRRGVKAEDLFFLSAETLRQMYNFHMQGQLSEAMHLFAWECFRVDYTYANPWREKMEDDWVQAKLDEVAAQHISLEWANLSQSKESVAIRERMAAAFRKMDSVRSSTLE